MSINTYDVIWEGLIYYLYKITLTSDDDNKKMMSKKSVLYVNISITNSKAMILVTNWHVSIS